MHGLMVKRYFSCVNYHERDSSFDLFPHFYYNSQCPFHARKSLNGGEVELQFCVKSRVSSFVSPFILYREVLFEEKVLCRTVDRKFADPVRYNTFTRRMRAGTVCMPRSRVHSSAFVMPLLLDAGSRCYRERTKKHPRLHRRRGPKGNFLYGLFPAKVDPRPIP